MASLFSKQSLSVSSIWQRTVVELPKVVYVELKALRQHLEPLLIWSASFLSFTMLEEAGFDENTQLPTTLHIDFSPTGKMTDKTACALADGCLSDELLRWYRHA